VRAGQVLTGLQAKSSRGNSVSHCGLPGAGKTTLDKRLATEHHALRLTPDAWMIPPLAESETGGPTSRIRGHHGGVPLSGHEQVPGLRWLSKLLEL
jgi:ABC-type molybdenum transport system ATPase subunit/photorepair protein PhrA